MKWFEQNKDKDDDFLQMFSALDPKRGEIEEEIAKNYSELRVRGEKVRPLVTLAVRDGEHLLYLSNMNDGKFALFLREGNKRRRRVYETLGTSSGRGVCYLCGEKADVGGYVLPNAGFKFSTADKKEFLYDLNPTQFWKSIPVCDECAENLENVHTYIERYLEFPRKTEPRDSKLQNKLRKTFFWVIPNGYGGMDKLFKGVDAFVRRNATGAKPGLVAVEDRLADYAKEIQLEPFTLTLLLFEKQKEHMDIRALVNDVLPSRLKDLDEIQEKIKMLPFFSEESMKRLFGRWWQGSFFGATKKNGPFVRGASIGNWPVLLLEDYYSRRVKNAGIVNYIIDNAFYGILNAVFLGKQLQIDVLSDLMVRIREAERSMQKGDVSFNEFREEMLRSLALYMYLKESSVIRSEMNMSFETLGCNVPREMEELFGNIGIQSIEERACVSMGILVGKVLHAQRNAPKEYGQRPLDMGKEAFWDKMNGLDIDHKRLQKLLKESVHKIRERGKGYPAIEQCAAYYLAKAGGMEGLSRGKISYFFTVGLVLSDTIWPSQKNVIHAEGDVNERTS